MPRSRVEFCWVTRICAYRRAAVILDGLNVHETIDEKLLGFISDDQHRWQFHALLTEVSIAGNNRRAGLQASTEIFANSVKASPTYTVALHFVLPRVAVTPGLAPPAPKPPTSAEGADETGDEIGVDWATKEIVPQAYNYEGEILCFIYLICGVL